LNESSPSDFDNYLERLRRGDEDATRSFVAKYEPFIRRTLRFRIARASLQSAADSVDVCQSVLGGFLLRLASGDYALATEEDLQRLLVAIANKKFLVLNRRETAAKRDHRQTQSLEDMKNLAVVENESKQRIAHADLLHEVTQRLAPDEQILFGWRRDGLAWNQIAEQLSEDVLTLRKRLSRALHRVAVELKLEEEDES
jgi:DNA-directed RNA polymerase specialized sigma24 family protein